MNPASGRRPDPFPAPTRHARGDVGGIATTVARMAFSDRQLVTISQDGRLTQWVEVECPAAELAAAPSAVGLQPSIGLTPRTLLGHGGGADRETTAHLVAAHVARQLAERGPSLQPQRVLLVGLGLRNSTLDRESFMDLVELLDQATL